MSGDLADRGVGKLFRPWAAGRASSRERSPPGCGQEKTKLTDGQQPATPEMLQRDSRPPASCGNALKGQERSWTTRGQHEKLDPGWCPTALNGFCGHPRTVAPAPATTSFGLASGHCPSVALLNYGPCAPGQPYAVYGPEVAVTGDGGSPVTPGGKLAKKQRPKRFPCPHCQVAFSNNGQLKGHVRIHTGERPFPCDFPDCGKTFTRNEELTRHKRIHLGLRPYACHACGKKFGRKDHLKKHVKTHQQKVALPGALVMADSGAAVWPPAAFYHSGYVLGLHPHTPHPAMFNAAADCGPFFMQWPTT